MKRNFRSLALAFVAIFAMSAVVASGASAFKLTSNSYPATISGTQIGTDVFSTNAGTVSCSEVTYSGSIYEASSEPEVTPSYSGCTAFGFINTPIDVNGCKYRTHARTQTNQDTYDGTLDVVCSGTNKITVTGSGCTVTIGSQNGLSSVAYTNNTAANPKDLAIGLSMSGIAYTVDTGCSTTKAGSFTNGTYTGEATLTAPGGLWID